jgi:hypothetical protein
LEQRVIELLDEDSTWAELLGGAGKSGGDEAVLAEAWKSLNPIARRRLLPKIVDPVEPHRTKPETRITFDPGIADAVVPKK